jgi:hypothetical protein
MFYNGYLLQFLYLFNPVRRIHPNKSFESHSRGTTSFSEKLFDFCGALGFIICTLVSLYSPYLKERFWRENPNAIYPPLDTFAPRQLLLSALVIIWATRLGLFLVRRVFKHGKDRRLDAIKVRPVRFLITWTIQGESDTNGVADGFADNSSATWIFIASLPVWAVCYLHSAFFRLLSGVI